MEERKSSRIEGTKGRGCTAASRIYDAPIERRTLKTLDVKRKGSWLPRTYCKGSIRVVEVAGSVAPTFHHPPPTPALTLTPPSPRAMKCFHPTKSEDREERDSRKREEPMYEFLRESICVEQKMKGDVFGIRSRILLNRRR
ncbi:hypothetical protein V1477_010246 [Vespula maculifrons]|uniref:Uncharacterized protein n=1 Tax=Vespula maculifrons TaxID=7453 RepID=A0ABD2C828_VESMC